MKTTMTIKELCARLEKEEKHIQNNLRIENGNLENDYYGVIIAKGDELPSDECECGHNEIDHTKSRLPRLTQLPRICRICPCIMFKPLLRTVKSIKLCSPAGDHPSNSAELKVVERCECGHVHPTPSNIAKAFMKKGESWCGDCSCKRFKPMQMVELEVE